MQISEYRPPGTKRCRVVAFLRLRAARQTLSGSFLFCLIIIQDCFFFFFFYLTGAEAKGWRPDSEEKISAYLLSFPVPTNEKGFSEHIITTLGCQSAARGGFLPLHCQQLGDSRKYVILFFLPFQASNLRESCSICIWVLLEVWSPFLKAPSSFKHAPNLCVNMLTSPTQLK